MSRNPHTIGFVSDAIRNKNMRSGMANWKDVYVHFFMYMLECSCKRTKIMHEAAYLFDVICHIKS